jgi:quercetin dioxygenase-like cupin family protein
VGHRPRRRPRAPRTAGGGDLSALDHIADIPPQRIWEGVTARSVQLGNLTLAVVELEPNAIVPEHRHENEQAGLVLAGDVVFTVGDETRELGPGGTWRIPGNTPHSVQVGPNGATVIDVFAPARADWEELERDEPRPPRWP